MPTITFSKKDFESLVGKKVTNAELEYFLSFAKGELDGVVGDEVSAGLDDTNQPYLWSVEGLARLAKGIFGIEKGIPNIKINKSNYSVIIDKDIDKVRPFISSFVAKGKKLSDEFLKQIIQLQEKLADSFGRKRKKLSIGLYSSKKITFPVHYRLEEGSTKFIPLEYSRELSINQILKEHPKGKDYAYILEGCKKYPVLIDDKENILSLAPIINSTTTGKLDVGEDELFFDCTGTDESAVMLCANIFAQALYDRGFKIFSCEMKYSHKKITSPDTTPFSITLDPIFTENLIGEKLSVQKIKDCLNRVRCEFKNSQAVFPCYRGDIMHMVDAIEDVAIGYGYDNLKPLPFTSYTKGSVLPKEKITTNVRNLIIGLEYQEIFSTLLSNKDLLYTKTNNKDLGTIEIDSYLSETYSVVRTWLIPCLLDLLSHNKHQDYPQKVFEQGIITLRKKDDVSDREHVAGLSAHPKADFTEARQIVEYILDSLGVKYSIKEFDHPSFISGRCAEILYKGKKIGFLGELHPSVLSNFNLLMSVCAFEFDLNSIIDDLI